MSLIMMESCDLPSVAGAKWDQFSLVAFAQTQDGRTCWRIADNRDFGLRKDFPAQEDDTIIVGMRLYAGSFHSTAAGGSIMSFWGDGGTVQHLTVETPNSNGSIDVRRAGTTILGTSAAGVLNTGGGAWQYLEVKVLISDTVGTVDVVVDGVNVLSLTGQDTRNGGTDALVDRVLIGAQDVGPDPKFAWVRDIVIMNGQGSSLNDFLGPVIVEARLPDGIGDLSEWTPNAGDNWTRVDDPGVNDGDSTIVESSAAGDRDTYTVADISAFTTAPLAVQAHVIARYDLDPLELATVLRRSATNDDGVADLPVGSYTSKALTIWETDPIAAGAWTLSNLNATQFGVLSATP